LALDELAGGELDRGSLRGGLQRTFDRPPPHLVVRQGDGGQAGNQLVGDDLLVVEADDGDVLRYA
jgi:hypothetical protein